MSEEKPLVLPELIGGDWEVLESKDMKAKTDLQNNVMWVPLSRGWLEGAVQLHEMAHAKWTPKEKYNDDPDMQDNGHPTKESGLGFLIQACEDRRIHHLLSESVSDWDKYGGAMLDYIDDIDTSNMDPELLVSLDMAGRQVKGEVTITYEEARLREIADFAEEVILSDPTNPAITWDAAKFIRDTLAAEKESESEGDGSGEGEDDEGDGEEEGSGSGICSCGDKYCDYDRRSSGDDDDDGEEEGEGEGEGGGKSWLPVKHDMKPSYKPPTPSRVSPSTVVTWEPDWDAPYAEYGNNWCDMEIVKPELTVSIPRERVVARGKKTAKTGNIPRHAHRILTGGAIFRSKRNNVRRFGGTVVIDVSGSMMLSDRDIDELLKTVRHGTVAMYSSNSEDQGRLTIIAKNFQAVKDNRNLRIGSGNGVDGPALQWLGTMPEPRAWICDGATTGRGDSGYGRAFCTELQRKHRIKRYHNIQRYLDDMPSLRARGHE